MIFAGILVGKTSQLDFPAKEIFLKNLSLAKKATVGAALLLVAMATGSLLAPASFIIGAISVPIILLFIVPYLKAATSPSRPLWYGMIILTGTFLALVSFGLFSVSPPLWWVFNQVISILAIVVMWINAP